MPLHFFKKSQVSISLTVYACFYTGYALDTLSPYQPMFFPHFSFTGESNDQNFRILEATRFLTLFFKGKNKKIKHKKQVKLFNGPKDILQSVT